MAAAFSLMTSYESCNWAINMDCDNFKRCRHVIIQTVLTTDMTKHFVELGQVKAITDVDGDFNFDEIDSKDKELFIKFMFHLADISNPTKKWKLCRLWCDLLFVEFFAQGDLEKVHEFKVDPLNDRAATNVAKSQIGFINFIVLPSFVTMIKVFPELTVCQTACEANKEEWTKLFEEYEKERENEN